MACKVGDVYYRTSCEDSGKVLVEEWHVRAIQRKTRGVLKADPSAKPRAFMTWKFEGVTWVKAGRGDKATWGWAERIAKGFKRDFDPDEGPGKLFAKSVSQACRIHLKEFGPAFEEYWKDDPDMLKWIKASRKALEARLAREMDKKQRKE